MGASNPNLVALGAPAFVGAGHGMITGGGALGTNARTRLNIDGTLPRPLLKPSFEESIYLVNGKIAQLLALTQRAPFTEIETDADEHEWTEDRLPPERTAATGSTAVGGVVLPVAYVDMFVAGDTVWIPDAGDAYGRVTTVTPGVGGAGTLTIAWLGAFAPTVAITANMAVINLGNTQPEIGVPVPRPFTDKVQKHCVMQEFWFPQAESHRIQKSRFQIGGDVLEYERGKLRTEAELKIEKTKWFGQQSWAAATGIGTMQGVYFANGARRVNFGGAVMTLPLFWDAVDRLRRHRYDVEGETWVWCSTAQRRTISAACTAASFNAIQPGEERHGISINRMIADDAKGDVMLVTSAIFDGLGRDDLMVFMRMDPKAIFNVRAALYPTLTWVPYIIPFGGSWDSGGYHFRGSQLFKDGFGHIEVVYNIGPSSASLI